MAALCVVQGGIASLLSNVIGGQLGQHLGLSQTYFLYAVVLLCINVGCLIWLLMGRKKAIKEQHNANI